MTAMEADPQIKTPTEEELTTVFAEVEANINSRPLTEVSSHIVDFQALSPSTLLNGALDPNNPIGERHDMGELRRDYRYATAVANMF